MRGPDGTVLFAAGDEITIDGTTGQVWLGRHEETVDVGERDDEILGRCLPELARLERWAQAGAAVAVAGA